MQKKEKGRYLYEKSCKPCGCNTHTHTLTFLINKNSRFFVCLKEET